MPLFEQLKQHIANNQLCALATVIASPGGARAKALIMPDGTAEGNMPDALKSEIVPHALRLMRHETSEIVTAADASVFIEVYAPPPSLVIFGGVHTAIPLSLFARTLGFHVTIVDGRAKFADPSRFPHADQVIHAWPQEAVPKLRFDSSTYVTVLTHDPKFDLPALKSLVYQPARYIGAMGSKKTRQEHFEQLKAEGVPEELLRRVYGPIGLDIGAVTPEEMALAIMAEIVMVRYNRDGMPLSVKEGGNRDEGRRMRDER